MLLFESYIPVVRLEYVNLAYRCTVFAVYLQTCMN
jgi:hypothetical protein